MPGYKKRIRRLAFSIIAGRWESGSLQERLHRILPDSSLDPERLARQLLAHFGRAQPPAPAALILFLQQNVQLCQILAGQLPEILLDPSTMGPLPESVTAADLPQLANWKDLRLWLGLFDNELAWFADREERQNRVTEAKLHHYRYRWIEKPSGSLRMIEIPKVRLKSIQRQILHQLLNQIPVHPCAHGFLRGRSSLSYVAPHVGKAVVLHMDMQHFFHSVPIRRIGALFRTFGYPPSVAWTLQGLCTHAVSPSLAGTPYQELPWEMKRHLQHKHLPQGAPTSPAIANLCAWRLDCRLQGVAERFGLDYTRYADDLAFSGPARLIRLAPFLQGLIGALVKEEGFRINHHKTRLNTRAQCQRLAGMVINERPNLSRRDYDRLRATLYNCIRHGPDGQNRQKITDYRAHLAGRIAYATWLNPARGERLKTLWAQIRWPS